MMRDFFPFTLFTLTSLILPPHLLADTAPHHEEIVQQIIYKTSNASEVTIVWGINEWQVPPDSMRPPNSYLKSEVLYTLMQGKRDSFVVNLKVPRGTYINYVFWLSKDSRGKEYDFWDKNYEDNYNVFVRDENNPKVHIDSYTKRSDNAFYLLPKGLMIFIFSAGVFLSLVYVYRKQKFFQHSVSRPTLLLGTGLSIFFIMVLARLQMNDITQQHPELLFGASFYDLLFLSVFIGVSVLSLSAIKKDLLKNVVFACMFILLLLTGFLAILNTEIVKHLGTPLNYQWLYYSGFLKSADAKAALSSNLSASMGRNISLLTLSFIVGGVAFSGLLSLHKKSKILVWSTMIFFISCLVIGSVQVHQGVFNHTKIDNPVVAFFDSWIDAEKKETLFTMKIDGAIRKEVADMHTSVSNTFFNKQGAIKNVIIFVIESLPAEYVDIYDSTFRATPNLLKWKNNARIFNNIYAHVPATPNSLFSLVSGLYPEIGYHLITKERPGLPKTSLASILHEKNWQSGAFNATDMKYGGMGAYLEKQGFGVIEDFKNINCSYQKFRVDWEYMDGIDDRCMANRALEWIKSTKTNTLTLCWTMQTHYPYFPSGTELQFTASNKDLNRYLNALRNTDEAFGMLMEGLRKENKLDETLVIVTGDHGEAFGRHDQTTHASKIYEENLHIPLLLISPKLFHGETDDRIGGLIDIAPTVSHVLGIRSPAKWEGRSLLNDRPKDRAFFFCPYADFLFGTRYGNWKFIYNASTRSSELYDLSNDPKESNNLAGEYPALADSQYQYLAAWIQFHTEKLKNLETQ